MSLRTTQNTESNGKDMRKCMSYIYFHTLKLPESILRVSGFS